MSIVEKLERQIPEALRFHTIDEANSLAAKLYGTREDCEGTWEERFIAAWVNAQDMIEEKTLKSVDAEFQELVYRSMII